MPLSTKEKVRLRGEAMRLKPALKVGREGFTEGVRKQLDALLAQHPLLKIRLEIDDRAQRAAVVEAIAPAVGAEFIGATGKTAVFFREGARPS
ncbi:MAG: YhbY family RNA-binding protein [Opitutales bacterium]